jgi:hypothetical protein
MKQARAVRFAAGATACQPILQYIDAFWEPVVGERGLKTVTFLRLELKA